LHLGRWSFRQPGTLEERDRDLLAARIDGSGICRVCFPGYRTPPIAGSGRYRAGG